MNRAKSRQFRVFRNRQRKIPHGFRILRPCQSQIPRRNPDLQPCKLQIPRRNPDLQPCKLQIPRGTPKKFSPTKPTPARKCLLRRCKRPIPRGSCPFHPRKPQAPRGTSIFCAARICIPVRSDALTAPKKAFGVVWGRMPRIARRQAVAGTALLGWVGATSWTIRRETSPAGRCAGRYGRQTGRAGPG